MIHGHGDDVYQYGEITANFSSNVYQQLDLSGLKQFLCQHIESVHAYPEPDAGSLANKIAEYEQIGAQNICVTNGATEAIYLIAQAFRGAQTAILSPVFSEYADACQIHKHKIKHIFDLNEIDDSVQLVWLCNPNNPTGEVYSKERLLELIRCYPQTCFVMDHSYTAFILSEHDMLNSAEAATYPNIILLHSMTKHFAIPGLRLGYMSAHIDMMTRINYFRMPWSVNQMALLAGHYLLAHMQELSIDLKCLLMQAKSLQENLGKIAGITILPTQTHFFLVQLHNNQIASELKKYLANEHQMLIRDASNFVGLDKTYFRVATQTPEKDNALVTAIRLWLNK